MTSSRLALLTKHQISAIARQYGNTDHDMLWLRLLIAEWLVHLGVFDDLQILDILRYVEHTDATLLVVGDSRYITYVRGNGNVATIYDVDDKKLVKPTQCVTSVVLDIKALLSVKGQHNGELERIAKGDTGR